MKAPVISAAVLALVVSSVAATNGRYTRTTAERGSIVVDASGQHEGSYITIGAAVKGLRNTTSAQSIFILPGTYTEQLYIPPLAGPLTIQGYTGDARSYKDNKVGDPWTRTDSERESTNFVYPLQVTITGNLSRQNPSLANNDATATVRLWTSNVKIYNLNMANTFGQAATSGQALALSAQKTNQGFYGCKFTGYQDTVYANEGRQIYAKSYISGAVDFIFGLRALAWFEDVDIESIGPGFVTANGREAENNTSIYVFHQSKVLAPADPIRPTLVAPGVHTAE
tara:strand:+ start:4206 stop:5054 length:849 start_codon:yes stop_codon:yes gene_type:complete